MPLPPFMSRKIRERNYFSPYFNFSPVLSLWSLETFDKIKRIKKKEKNIFNLMKFLLFDFFIALRKWQLINILDALGLKIKIIFLKNNICHVLSSQAVTLKVNSFSIFFSWYCHWGVWQVPEVGGGHLTLAPKWLDPEDNGGAVKRFQLGLHYSLIYCDRPPRPAVTALHCSHLLGFFIPQPTGCSCGLQDRNDVKCALDKICDVV